MRVIYKPVRGDLLLFVRKDYGQGELRVFVSRKNERLLRMVAKNFGVTWKKVKELAIFFLKSCHNIIGIVTLRRICSDVMPSCYNIIYTNSNRVKK